MKRITITAALGAAAMLVLSACGGDSGGGSDGDADDSVAAIAQYDKADRQEHLETCAKEEKNLTFYTVQNDEIWQPFVASFTEKYPFVKVDTVRRSSVDMIPTITKEAQAKKLRPDVISVPWEYADQITDYMEKFSSPELAAYPDDAIQNDGRLVLLNRTAMGLVYNTDKVDASEVPQKPEDLLDARWTGRMALSSSSGGTRLIGSIKHEVGDDAVEKLAKLDIRVQKVNSSAIASLVAAGEADIAPQVPIATVEELQAKGAPLKWSPVSSNWLDDMGGITSTASHPCSAMLFLDHMLSAEAQSELDAAISARTDVDLPDLAQVSDAPADQFHPVTLADFVKQDEYADAFRGWSKDMETIAKGKG